MEIQSHAEAVPTASVGFPTIPITAKLHEPCGNARDFPESFLTVTS